MHLEMAPSCFSQPRARLQVLAITLPACSRYLDSLLQLQTRIQLGLEAEELFALLEVHGFSPCWLTSDSDIHERHGLLTLSVELPHLQFITCTTTKVTLH